MPRKYSDAARKPAVSFSAWPLKIRNSCFVPSSLDELFDRLGHPDDHPLRNPDHEQTGEKQ
jgi:hypothetical protein